LPAVWTRARADLRARWKAWLLLALLVGAAAGAIIAAAAGARRTDTAYQRFSQAYHAPNVILFGGSPDPTFAQLNASQVAHLSPVSQVATGFLYSPTGTSSGPVAAGLLGSTDSTFGTTMMAHKILAGRSPRPDRPDEVLVSFLLAQHRHLGVGDRFSQSFTPAGGGPPVTVSLRVVGIEASPGEFPSSGQAPTDDIWATPAFSRAHAAQGLAAIYPIALQLRGGAGGVPVLSTELRALTGGKPYQSLNFDDIAGDVERSIHLQAVALWLLAGLLAIVALLVVGQALVRQSFLESAEYPDLRALGMDRVQLWGVGMTRAATIALAAAPVAVVVAFLLSPFTPIGLARVAEPTPGFAADALALGVGALATIAVVLIVSAVPAWLDARSRLQRPLAAQQASAPPALAAGALSRAGAPPSLTTGVRLALEPGAGRRAVPVRSTLAGAVIGVAAVATAFGFNASLDHLLTTPRLYGAPWDLEISPSQSSNALSDVTPTIPVAQTDGQVADASLASTGIPLSVGGTSVQAIALDPVKGQTLTPAVLEGRAPSGGRAEVMLGTQTLRAAHATVGGTVSASILGVTPAPASVRVVGRGIFPNLGTTSGLGQGAFLTKAYGLRALLPPGVHPPPPDTLLVRLAPGVDRAHAQADLARRLQAVGSYQIATPNKPVDLVNFGRVQDLPLVLAGFVAALAAATLAHLLVSSIRRRRRDLAVLKTLGFVPAQVRAAVAWQATTLAVVAVALGIPIGVAAGRWAWLAFTHQLGIVPEAAVPLLVLLVMIPATLVVANLVAILPARAAARAQPAGVLRSE
jgi:hypothetical protein